MVSQKETASQSIAGIDERAKRVCGLSNAGIGVRRPQVENDAREIILGPRKGTTPYRA
jgi:hypothetical protein